MKWTQQWHLQPWGWGRKHGQTLAIGGSCVRQEEATGQAQEREQESQGTPGRVLGSSQERLPPGKTGAAPTASGPVTMEITGLLDLDASGSRGGLVAKGVSGRSFREHRVKVGRPR